jgi:hypothetical protein
MGIYTNDVVYGMRIEEKRDGEYVVLYEKKNEERELSREEKDEVIFFYEGMENKKCLFSMYVECYTTYDEEDEPYKEWQRRDKNEFYCVLQR